MLGGRAHLHPLLPTWNSIWLAVERVGCPPPHGLCPESVPPLTASSYALYGERLGLLEESPQPESLHFIHAVETMLRTTLPLLFLPPGVMRWVNHKLWQDHMEAWDAIFKHGQGWGPLAEGGGGLWGSTSLLPRAACSGPVRGKRAGGSGQQVHLSAGPTLCRASCCVLASCHSQGPAVRSRAASRSRCTGVGQDGAQFGGSCSLLGQAPASGLRAWE